MSWDGFSTFAEAFREPLALVSTDGRILSLNRPLEKILGGRREDFFGRSLLDVLDAQPNDLLDYLSRCSRSREPVPGAFSMMTVEGTQAYRVEGARVATDGEHQRAILLRLSPKVDAARTFGVLNEKIEQLNQEIRGRHRAESLLREQKEWLHSALASIAEGIIVTDVDGHVRLMNEEAERLTGCTAAGLRGRPVEEVVHTRHEESDETFENAALVAIRGGSVVKRSGAWLVARDGTECPIQETASPIRGEKDEIVGAVLVIRDVTREREAADEIRRAKDVAESANRAKSVFLASVSHELRTPMNAIIGMTELALESELDAEVRDYLSTARESAGNLLHLLDDLLDLSKIEARKLVLEEHPFELRDTVYDCVRVVSTQAAEKGLELTCHVEPSVPDRVRGDAQRLRQVLLNLLGNAIKFTERGEVSVEVAADAVRDGFTELHFRVRDTGVGIAASDRERIFSPFVQSDSSTSRVYGGTGLGLSIASALVSRMQGTVSVASEPKRGSTFHVTVELPVDESSGTAPGRSFQIPEELRGQPVLVVDDVPASLKVVTCLLEEWGIETTAVASYEEALAACARAAQKGRPFRLAIVDGLLSEIDGNDVRRLRDHVTGLILMLPPVERKRRNGALAELPVSAFLDKPVMLAGLRSALVRSVGGESPPDPRVAAIAVTPNGTKSLRILLAEDTRANRKLLEALLNKAGHLVRSADSGEKAVELYREHPFDLILMDVQMPRVDGFEATRRIRAEEKRTGRRVPILALSAHAMSGFRERCLSHGMDDYMAKPFTGAELHSRILALTGSEQTQGRGANLVLPQTLRDGFLKDFDSLLHEIRTAVENADAKGLARAAHSLRGSAAFLDSDSISRTARALEEMGEANDLGRAARTVSTLDREIDAFRRANSRG